MAQFPPKASTKPNPNFYPAFPPLPPFPAFPPFPPFPSYPPFPINPYLYNQQYPEMYRNLYRPEFAPYLTYLLYSNMGYPNFMPFPHLEDYIKLGQYANPSFPIYQETISQDEETCTSEDFCPPEFCLPTSSIDTPKCMQSNTKTDQVLIGGTFKKCYCKRRYGLQDLCQRVGCNGSPKCEPSEFDKTFIGDKYHSSVMS